MNQSILHAEPLSCYHVNEKEREYFEISGKPYHEFVTHNSTFFLITNRPGFDQIEGFLGRTDWQDTFFNELNHIHSYFIDYQKREKVYFTFNKTDLYELVNIIPGKPMTLNLQLVRKDKEKNNTITTNNLHINGGNGNIISTGNNNTITVSTTITKNDTESLKDALKNYKVSNDDIREILDVLKTDKPDNAGQLGSKTSSWIKKMLSKSLDGTWEISIATAGGILTEMLKKFFGI